MDPKQMAKQTFDFYKTSFENMLNAMTMLQEQSQKMIDLYLDQMTGFPDEGKKAIQDWNKSLKKEVQISRHVSTKISRKLRSIFPRHPRGNKTDLGRQLERIKSMDHHEQLLKQIVETTRPISKQYPQQRESRVRTNGKSNACLA